jgi:hypothetical protein
MSLRLMSAAWAANLPSTPKLVLLALADNANDEGNCAPSIKTIMGKCSLSERAIFTNINLLEKGGFLLRQSRQFKSNIYTITPPNTWQTERAKPSKQRQKQAEVDEKIGSTPAQYAPPAFGAPPAPSAPTTITIKSKAIGLCADASTREVHANAWLRDAVVDSLPDWLDREAFFEYREHRRTIKKPLTPQSEKLAIKTLFDVFNNGESQREIIERSILNGWAGLFPNSKKNNSGNKPEKFNAFNFLVEKNRGAGNERDITNECE